MQSGIKRNFKNWGLLIVFLHEPIIFNLRIYEIDGNGYKNLNSLKSLLLLKDETISNKLTLITYFVNNCGFLFQITKYDR